jgi:hypothetical protein
LRVAVADCPAEMLASEPVEEKVKSGTKTVIASGLEVAGRAAVSPGKLAVTEYAPGVGKA